MRLAACLLCALLLPLGSALPAQAPAKDKAPDAPRWEAQNKLLMEARRLILAHRCQEALDGPLADVLPQDKRASDELNYVRGRIRDKP